jgi:tetratricopeptide (TPR) repeat protein
VRAWCLKGDAYEELGWREQALEAYDQALSISGDDAVALSNKAICLRQVGRHREAADCFERRLQSHPDDHQAAWGLAMSLDDGGEKATAVAAYRRYLALGTGIEARESRARERLESLEGRTGGPAREIAAGLVAPTGLGVDEYLKRAAININQRQYERALALYEQAHQADPTSRDALRGEGDCLRALGRSAEAVERYRLALEQGEHDTSLSRRLGEVLMEAGATAEALEVLRRAAAGGDADAHTWDALGRASMVAGLAEEALEAFGRALGKDPRLAMARFHQAQTCDRLERRAEALEAYQQFLSVAPPLLQNPIQEARRRIQALRSESG